MDFYAREHSGFVVPSRYGTCARETARFGSGVRRCVAWLTAALAEEFIPPALEAMNPDQAAELLEDLADGAYAREALAELAAGPEPVPAEQVWAELGIDQ
jgi:hypothetical protein